MPTPAASGRKKRPAPVALPMRDRAQIIAKRAGTIILLLLILLGLILWWASRWTPDREAYPLQGVNVDASNGDIDWGWVKAAGADFAYISATSGAKRGDAHYKVNLSGAKEVGLKVGAIHHYDLCNLAADQASNFIRHVPRQGEALPAVIWLDFDEHCEDRPTRALLLSELATFLAQIEAHSGKRSLIAPSPSFEKEYGVSRDIARTIWLRRDFFEPTYGAHSWTMWQANRYIRIAGASGTVGWNVVRPNGDNL